MKQKLIVIIRWIGVLPCAIIACALAYLLANICQSFYADEKSKYAIYVIPVASSLVSGLAFLYSGVITAPAYRKYVALILMVLLCVSSVIGGVLNVVDGEYFKLFKAIAALVGVVLAYFMFQDEEQSA